MSRTWFRGRTTAADEERGPHLRSAIGHLNGTATKRAHHNPQQPTPHQPHRPVGKGEKPWEPVGHKTPGRSANRRRTPGQRTVRSAFTRQRWGSTLRRKRNRRPCALCARFGAKCCELTRRDASISPGQSTYAPVTSMGALRSQRRGQGFKSPHLHLDRIRVPLWFAAVWRRTSFVWWRLWLLCLAALL